MAPPPGTDEVHARENFAKFFECWIAEQERDLQNLRSAFASAAADSPADDHPPLQQLIDRVLGHYEYYYRAKASSARADVASMFSPSWISSTENLFLWVGGWRPTLIFHLLYSKSGLQFESHLDDILGGGGRMGQLGDLAVLTHDQLLRVDRLHQRTVRREREISEEAARAQEAVADAEMVGLSSTVAAEGEEGVRNEAEMEAAMGRKCDTMRAVLEQADNLRLETLKAVVEMLRPAQAVQFMISAAELHLKVHEFGKNKDAATTAADGRIAAVA